MWRAGDPVILPAEAAPAPIMAEPAPALRLSGNLFYTDIRDAQRARSVTFQPPGSPPALAAPPHSR